MKAHNKKEKEDIAFQFAVGLFKALKDHGYSVNQLALEMGVEKSHLQLIANGKKNITLSTQIAITNGLKISFSEIASYYDSVTDADKKEFKAYQKSQQKLKGHVKKSQ